MPSPGAFFIVARGLLHSARMRSIETAIMSTIDRVEAMGVARHPRRVPGQIDVDGRPFRYVDLHSFYHQAHQIFRDRLYDFSPAQEAPVIVDGGAHVGLAALFFAGRFPRASIECYEADPAIAELLDANMRAFGADRVKVHASALWVGDEGVDFTASGDDAGHVSGAVERQRLRVPSVRLRDLLARGKLDLLKLDVEGAEYDLVQDCDGVLSNARHLIIEVHQLRDQAGSLGQLLTLLERNGFAYTMGDLHQATWLADAGSTPFRAAATPRFIVTVYAWRKQPLRVLQVSDHQITGGAASAAHRLHRGLRARASVEVDLVCVNAPTDPSLPGKDWLHAFQQLGCQLPPGTGADPEAGWRAVIEAVADAARPDVINVHNIHEGVHNVSVPLEQIDALAARAPVVVTMHDMWWFTGRCAYAGDCVRYREGACDQSCPTPNVYPKLRPDRIAAQLRLKRELFTRRRDRLAFVAPSRWLAGEARRSMLAAHRIEVIPYGVDLQVFRPSEQRADARRAIGIRPDELVLIAVAADLKDERKGMHLLWDALSRTAAAMTVLLLGKGPPPGLRRPGLNMVPLGFVSDPSTLAQLYGAADLFVSPALADNLPNVLLESIACGTPCLGFPVGGTPDVIRPGQTGWLASGVDADSLLRALEEVARAPGAAASLRATCRQIAEAEYGLDVQARRYEALFRELAEGAGAQAVRPSQTALPPSG